MPQDKVWDDAKPLEQKFPGALLELWKMREAAGIERRARERFNDPPHWLQSRGPAPAGRKPTEIGNRVSNFFPSFSRFWLPQLLKEEPIRHAEFVEAAGRPKLNAAQIKMQREFDSEGPGYDEKTADELRKLAPLPATSKPKREGGAGETVVYKDPTTGVQAHEAWVWHPERNDWLRHGASRDPRSGQSLKGRLHPSYKKFEEGEKKAGYTIYKDPKSGKYYSTPRHAKGPTRANIFTGLSGLAQGMQNR